MIFEEITILQAVENLIKNKGVWLLNDDNLLKVNSIEIDNEQIRVIYFDTYELYGDIENLKFFQKVIDK